MLFVCAAYGAGGTPGQLLLVVADDMNASTALLQRYDSRDGRWEKTGRAVRVNLGRNGLGWGLGETALPHGTSDPVKHEGDGRAPAGIFALGPVFGYAAEPDTRMPYERATADLICIDDDRSDAYNTIVPIAPTLRFRSFEWMKRDDGLYRLGVVVRHNAGAIPGRGSCIFLHIQSAPGSGTAGCTSMQAAPLQTVIRWLRPDKAPLLVQIPAKSLPAVYELFGLPGGATASGKVQ